MAPTDVLPLSTTVQVGELRSVVPVAGWQTPPAGGGGDAPSPEFQPPNPAPVGDSVKVTVVPVSYVPVQTDPPDPVQPGPQWIKFGVPVSEGAVTSQVVVFSPAL